MQDPPLWFSINAGLLLYLTLASLSYWVGRVPKKLYKAEVREFIDREYKRAAPLERVRTVKPSVRVALDTRALSKRVLREVVVDNEVSGSGSSDEESEEDVARAEREAYRQYFLRQAECAQPATESASIVADTVAMHLSGSALLACGQASRVKRL